MLGFGVKNELEQCRAELELKSNYLAAIRKSMAWIEFSPSGEILDANPLFLTVIGYELAEIKGKHHRIFCTKTYADSPEYVQFWRSLAQGESFTNRYLRKAKDGNELWLEATYMPITDSNGQVLRVAKIAMDVTEQLEEERRHESTIDAISRSMAVIEFNLDGQILAANSNFLSTMGYRLDEILGKHHSLFCTPEHMGSDAYRQFWQRLNRGEFISDRFKRVSKSGQVVWLRATYNPLYGQQEGRFFHGNYDS